MKEYKLEKAIPVKDWNLIRDEELRDPEIASAFLSKAFETGTSSEIDFAIQCVLEANGTKPLPSSVEELVQLRRLGMHINVSYAVQVI